MQAAIAASLLPTAALAAWLELGNELNALSAKITVVNRLACFMEVAGFCLGRWVRRRGAAARFLAIS